MSDDTMALTEWLENQKQRAEDHINDDRVGDKETERWRGERQLIDAMQKYLDSGVLELD